jgi:hypothetical protein
LLNELTCFDEYALQRKQQSLQSLGIPAINHRHSAIFPFCPEEFAHEMKETQVDYNKESHAESPDKTKSSGMVVHRTARGFNIIVRHWWYIFLDRLHSIPYRNAPQIVSSRLYSRPP